MTTTDTSKQTERTDIDREGSLPSGVTLSVSAPAWTGGRWCVEYVGTPEQLRAAGIVDDVMEPKILHQRSGVMLSARRIEFRVRSAAGYASEPKRVLWERGEALTLQFRPNAISIMALPGVRELYPDGIPERTQESFEQALTNEDDRTVSWLDRCAATAQQRYGGGIIKRERVVGRFQRLVSWASVGQILLIPDFVKIRAHVIVDRGGN